MLQIKPQFCEPFRLKFEINKNTFQEIRWKPLSPLMSELTEGDDFFNGHTAGRQTIAPPVVRKTLEGNFRFPTMNCV